MIFQFVQSLCSEVEQESEEGFQVMASSEVSYDLMTKNYFFNSLQIHLCVTFTISAALLKITTFSFSLTFRIYLFCILCQFIKQSDLEKL